MKNSVGGNAPSPAKYVGPASKDVVLTFGPRFTGGCQAKSSCVCARREAQMSLPPWPPGRVLAKNMMWPSRENVGTVSAKLVLMVGPRFTGGPHGSSTLARRE